jgi:hypothetical protein
MLPTKVIRMEEARRRLRRAQKARARVSRNVLQRSVDWLRTNVPSGAWIVTGVLAGFIFGAVLAHASVAQVAQTGSIPSATAQQQDVLP